VHQKVHIDYDSPPGACRLRDVRDINENDTRLALVGPGHGTDRVDEVRLRVGNDIVRTTSGKVLEVTSKVVGVAEQLGLGRVDSEQLLHVEDLDAVADSLTTDDHVVVLATDLTPLAARRVLGQASEVDELALLTDLCERSSVRLSDGDKLTSGAGGPSCRLSVR
jgi:hypothetical protein